MIRSDRYLPLLRKPLSMSLLVKDPLAAVLKVASIFFEHVSFNVIILICWLQEHLQKYIGLVSFNFESGTSVIIPSTAAL